MNLAKRARRLELQKAAYEVACKKGFHSITLEQIARQAGTSKGIVHHYFRDKRELIEHAVRYAHLVYRTAVIERLKRASTPSERLWSVVDATFESEQFKPEICRLWLTILDEIPHDEKLGRLVAILDKRSVSITISAIKELVEPDEVDEKAYSIMSLLDGFWILSASDPQITRKVALSYIADYLLKNIPRFDHRAIEKFQ